MTSTVDTRCTGCDAHVLHTSSGRVLQPQPHRIGLYDPASGDVLTAQAAVDLIRATGTAGHAEHHCPSGQTALFDTQEA